MRPLDPCSWQAPSNSMICAKMWKHALPYFLACCLFLFVSLFLCVFLLVSWFVCLFVCFSLVTHVTSAGHIRSACHGTSPRHIMASCHVMMSGANLSNRVHSAAQWAASAHTLPMSKPVITPVLKALRNGLLRRIYFTHAQTCVMTYVFKMLCYTYFTHSQTCDNVRGQGATRWTASAHALHIPKPVITFMVKVLRNGLLRYRPYTCPSL